MINPFDIPDKIKDSFTFFFEKFGNFIDTIQIALQHIFFWVVVLVFIIVVTGLVYGFIKIQKPFSQLKQSLEKILNKVM